jgi:hypothetical protein
MAVNANEFLHGRLWICSLLGVLRLGVARCGFAGARVFVARATQTSSLFGAAR